MNPTGWKPHPFSSKNLEKKFTTMADDPWRTAQVIHLNQTIGTLFPILKKYPEGPKILDNFIQVTMSKLKGAKDCQRFSVFDKKKGVKDALIMQDEANKLAYDGYVQQLENAVKKSENLNFLSTQALKTDLFAHSGLTSKKSYPIRPLENNTIGGRQKVTGFGEDKLIEVSLKKDYTKILEEAGRVAPQKVADNLVKRCTSAARLQSANTAKRPLTTSTADTVQ